MSDTAPPVRIVPAGFFLLRSPLLPFDEFLRWSETVEAGSRDSDDAGSTGDWQQGIQAGCEHLRSLLERPDVEAALFLASPGVVRRLKPAADATGSAVSLRDWLVLARYVSRLCGKPTPFGLMAGTTLGRIGDGVNLVLREPEPRVTVRPSLLRRVVERLLQVPDVAASLPVELNSSVVAIAGRYHYYSVEQAARDDVTTQLAFEGPGLLDEVLQRAREDTSVRQLARLVEDHSPDTSPAQSLRLVMDLVNRRILVPACYPAVTADSELDDLVQELKGIPAASKEVACLVDVRNSLGRGNGPGGSRLATLCDATAKLGALVAASEDEALLQAELLRPGQDVTLDPALLQRAGRGIRWLHAWLAPRIADPLADFRAAFLERYGTASVPLGMALDPEAGIGSTIVAGNAFGASPLLADLQAAGEDAARQLPLALGEEQLALLAERIETAVRSDETAIDVTDVDLAVAAGNALPLPNQFAALGRLARVRGKSGGDAYRFFLEGIAGPPASILLGRHCAANPELRAAVGGLASGETGNGDAIHAEVIYAPSNRVADVQARPVLSEYEIPLLGRSSLSRDQQLRISDLVVSLENGIIQLRSLRLGRRVVPRMSTPHDFRRDINPVYRFLCLLQAEGYCSRLQWSWGELESRPFLPRVNYEGVVLAAARWRLVADELRSCMAAEGAARYAAFSSLRRDRRLPRFAYFLGKDGRLLCDFDNALCVEMLLEQSRGRDSITLEEMFPSPEQLPVSGPGGRYVHDIVVPYRRDPPELPSRITVHRPAGGDLAAAAANDDWLYFKLYSGPATADRLLRQLREAIPGMTEGAGVTSWHFLRYSDPNPHLRLRFHGAPRDLQGALLSGLGHEFDALQEAGLLWRHERAVYEPEIERYGGQAGLSLCEAVFWHDSVAAVEIVTSCPGDAEEQARWLLATRGVHQLLDDFELDDGARIDMLKSMQSVLLPEFAVDSGAVKAAAGRRYRRDRQTIEAVLDDAAGDDIRLAAGLAALRQRSAAVQPLASELASLAQASELEAPITSVVSSLVHMQCNRILRWPARHQEYFLYAFLERYYRSRLARNP